VTAGFALDGDAVVLDLADACIETAARRARRRLTDELLGDDAADERRGRALELLDAFLARTDLRRLRADDEELAGGRPCRVRLARARDGGVSWTKLR
jgi:hypothetical protein